MSYMTLPLSPSLFFFSLLLSVFRFRQELFYLDSGFLRKIRKRLECLGCDHLANISRKTGAHNKLTQQNWISIFTEYIIYIFTKRSLQMHNAQHYSKLESMQAGRIKDVAKIYALFIPSLTSCNCEKKMAIFLPSGTMLLSDSGKQLHPQSDVCSIFIVAHLIVG